jgi:cellulase/cellobiase CelA1
MRAILKLFIDFIHKPEWVAAVALLIQAVILWLQARILRRHGMTMEEHAGIAKTQAATAELIGKALEQQGTVLAGQAKLTEEQYRFQRRIEAQAARSEIYKALLALNTTIDMLIRTGSQNPRAVEMEKQVFSTLIDSTVACQNILITGIHLTSEDKDIFYGLHLRYRAAGVGQI